jgi:hypothetical protein
LSVDAVYLVVARGAMSRAMQQHFRPGYVARSVGIGATVTVVVVEGGADALAADVETEKE